MPPPQSRTGAHPDPARSGRATLDVTALGLDVVEHSPPQLVQAIGARVWSDDGAEYVDFDNLGGAVLLGHRDSQVVAAVRLARGGDQRALERCQRDVADRIRKLTPSAEACAFGGEVSQALRAAATAAQLYTGRDAVFACRTATGGGAGRLKGDRFPFDDLAALERLIAMHGQPPAAIVLAPCGGHAPSPDYLKGLRQLCDATGAVLVFDETFSGFRVHEGGAQALYGVEADLAVFGESLANGMPLSVLAGRRDLVWAAQQHEPLRADIGCLAAARAVLAKIEAEPVIATLRVGGAEIQAEVCGRLEAAGLDDAVALVGDPAACRLEFRPLPGIDPQALRSLWMNECRAHRLFTLGAVNMSYAHGERDIAVLLAAFDQAADRLARALRQAVPQSRPRGPRKAPAAQSFG